MNSSNSYYINSSNRRLQEDVVPGLEEVVQLDDAFDLSAPGCAAILVAILIVSILILLIIVVILIIIILLLVVIVILVTSSNHRI